MKVRKRGLKVLKNPNKKLRGEVKRMVRKEGISSALVFLAIILSADKDGQVLIEKPEEATLEKFINSNWEVLMNCLEKCL